MGLGLRVKGFGVKGFGVLGLGLRRLRHSNRIAAIRGL